MSKVFEDTACAEFLLKVILNRDDLTVQDVEAALGMTVKAVESGGKDFLDAALNLDYHTERNNENFVYIKAYDREDE